MFFNTFYVIVYYLFFFLFIVLFFFFFFFFQAEDGIRDLTVTGVQTCALPIFGPPPQRRGQRGQAGGRLPGLVGRHVERLAPRSEEHTSELQSQSNLVCRLLLEKKKKTNSKKCTNKRNRQEHQAQ